MTRPQSAVSILAFAHSGTFDGSLTVFANVPNSILFGVHCQPRRGRKQEHERVNRRRMNQWVCERESGRQKHKNKTASLSLAGPGYPATPDTSFQSIKAWWKNTSVHSVYVCVCVSAVTRQCFHYKCPYSSHGPLIDYCNMSNISVLASTNQPTSLDDLQSPLLMASKDSAWTNTAQSQTNSKWKRPKITKYMHNSEEWTQNDGLETVLTMFTCSHCILQITMFIYLLYRDGSLYSVGFWLFSVAIFQLMDMDAATYIAPL